MRFSSQGLWGRANYFAKNASYSDRYSHACGGGQKQMFMAKVRKIGQLIKYCVVFTITSCWCPLWLVIGFIYSIFYEEDNHINLERE